MQSSEQRMVWTGRIAIVISMVVAVLFTWNDLLGIGRAGGYTFVQKYTSYISPGVFATFILGMFWKRTNSIAAFTGIIFGFLISVFFNEFAVKVFGPETILYTAFPNMDGIYEIPFFICLSWSFLITVLVMVGTSILGPRINPKAFELDAQMFKLKPSSIVLIVSIMLLLIAIYARFW